MFFFQAYEHAPVCIHVRVWTNMSDLTETYIAVTEVATESACSDH